jgi:hypothetical protein
MNNRMKQLAEQAGMHAFPPVMDYDKKETQWTGWDSSMKKFAELIVRECGEWCGHDAQGVAAMFKHFGVTE